MMPLIDQNREQLVIDLASDYSERVVMGKPVSIKEYLDKLPDDASRKAFKAAANMSRFIATIDGLKREENSSHEDSIEHEDIIPMPSSRI